MAKRTITTDDLTGEESGTREVKVVIAGVSGTLDLTDRSVEALSALARGEGPGKLRKLLTTPSGPTGVHPRSDPEENAAIREWAAGSGVKISPRGRIPKSVIAQYRNANGAPATEES